MYKIKNIKNRNRLNTYFTFRFTFNFKNEPLDNGFWRFHAVAQLVCRATFDD